MALDASGWRRWIVTMNGRMTCTIVWRRYWGETCSPVYRFHTGNRLSFGEGDHWRLGLFGIPRMPACTQGNGRSRRDSQSSAQHWHATDLRSVGAQLKFGSANSAGNSGMSCRGSSRTPRPSHNALARDTPWCAPWRVSRVRRQRRYSVQGRPCVVPAMICNTSESPLTQPSESAAPR